jgi:hypothetical protein
MATSREARLGYVPHFDVMTIDGRRVQYDQIWQRQNLVLVVLSGEQRATAVHYASQLQAHAEQFKQEETTVVVTVDSVPKLSAPTVLVADRWGEILFLASSSDQTSRLPDVEELLSWVHFAEIQCPVCPP